MVFSRELSIIVRFCISALLWLGRISVMKQEAAVWFGTRTIDFILSGHQITGGDTQNIISIRNQMM